MKVSFKTALLLAGISILSLLLGVFTARWMVENDSPKSAEISQINVPKIRPAFSMPDLEGKIRQISEWNDKVVVLNFWATWCPPCLREMPIFIKLREDLSDQPFEIIGVAIDQRDPVQDFVDQLGVEYPILLGEITGIRIMQDYGNQLSTLPYTVVINRQREIVKVFRKEVTRQEILRVIGPLLNLKDTGKNSP